MRPLELLLALANLAAFLTLTVASLRRWNKMVVPLAAVVAVTQALIEGVRWQMVPAYALNAAFLVVWVLQRDRSSAPRSARPLAARLGAGLAALLGALGLVVSTALPMLIPIFHFPHPTGPYAVGTVTEHWIDTARGEVFTPDPNDHRELMVQIWFPARGDRSAPRAKYIEHSETLAPLAQLMKLPGFVLSHLRYVVTNAIPSASVAEGGPFPVLVMVHGRGGMRQENTMLAEELASHGYVVAGMDQPYAASGVAFPDGRMAPFDPRMFDPSHPGHPAFLDRVMPFLAQDAQFTLDQLARLNRSDPRGLLTGRLDLARAGIFGHSLGGAVTGEACLRDARFKAGLAIDVWMPPDVARSGLRQPMMWITRDAASMKLERWDQRDIDETQGTIGTVFASLPGDGYVVRVPGAFHANFSDLPLFSPLARRLGLIGPIDAERADTILNTFALAFFDRHLKGRPAPLLDHPEERFPEVRLERRRS